jgi:uncharacterized protein YqiB (DUF1249 family)
LPCDDNYSQLKRICPRHDALGKILNVNESIELFLTSRGKYVATLAMGS